jgi:hypothetical protein
MGCNTCKQNNGSQTKAGNQQSDNPNYVPLFKDMDLFKRNFFLKILIFLIMTAAIPLVIIGVWLMVFFNIFLPKKGKKNIVQNWINKIFTFFIVRKAKRLERHNKLKFKDNRGYDGDNELTDIEVVISNDNTEEDDE